MKQQSMRHGVFRPIQAQFGLHPRSSTVRLQGAHAEKRNRDLSLRPSHLRVSAHPIIGHARKVVEQPGPISSGPIRGPANLACLLGTSQRVKPDTRE